MHKDRMNMKLSTKYSLESIEVVKPLNVKKTWKGYTYSYLKKKNHVDVQSLYTLVGWCIHIFCVCYNVYYIICLQINIPTLHNYIKISCTLSVISYHKPSRFCLFIEYRRKKINFLKSINILPLLLKSIKCCLFCGMFIDNCAVRKTLWHYEYSKMLIN